MAHLAHSLDRRAVSSAGKAGDLNLEAKQFQALRPIFNPFLPAINVVLNATQQVVSDPTQFKVVDVVNKVVEPTALGL